MEHYGPLSSHKVSSNEADPYISVFANQNKLVFKRQYDLDMLKKERDYTTWKQLSVLFRNNKDTFFLLCDKKFLT